MINKKIKTSFGISLVELIIAIGTIFILLVISVPVFIFFQKRSDLNNNTEELINVLRIAQNKTLASEGASQYGVYFDTSTSPHQYTLFKGSDFASRDPSLDKVYKLSSAVEIYDINIGGGNELVFNRLTGSTNQSGSISLRLITDATKTKTIYLETSGQVSLLTPLVPGNSRIVDSRHVHFDYSRIIDTATESLTLDFGTKTEVVPVATNLSEGQIYWQREVDVDGETQLIKIHTHRLNGPDTQFCVHRDRRYNTKPLVITISGDGSGNLIDYSADGLTTNFSSIYVSDLSWQ